MRNVLFGGCLLGLSVFASAPAEAGSIPLPQKGTLHAKAGTTYPCAWNVDGIMIGVSSELEVALFAGQHTLKCKRLVDGALSTQIVDIAPSQKTEIVIALPVLKGEIVAVSVGGSCSFSVNGASKGTSSQLRLWVTPGAYSISCKASNGAQKSRSVIVKPAESAMAMFKWQ